MPRHRTEPSSDPVAIQTEMRRAFAAGEDGRAFYLPPGDYEFETGIRIGRRWRIFGSGIGVTRVRFVPGSGFSPNERTTHFFMPADSVDVRFEDFTLDCAWDIFEPTGSAGVTGIGGFLDGGFRCERAEIFNHGALNADAGGAIFPNNISRVARRIVLRDLWIHTQVGVQAHSVALASNNHHSFDTITEALVENCLIEGGWIGIGVQGSNCRVVGNTIRNAQYGAFGDTGFLFNNIYESNWLYGTHYPFYFDSLYSDPQPGFYRCSIRGNIIYPKEDGLGIYLGRNCLQNTIEMNTLFGASNQSLISVTAGNNERLNTLIP